MISVSSGTAGVLGLSKLKPKVAPTTAYIMLGDACVNNCKFCSQSVQSSGDKKLLSRVDWANYDEKEVFEKANVAYKEGKIKRLCFQVVDGKDSFELTLSTLKNLKKFTDIPVCASSTAKTMEEAKELFEAGLDRVCVALDAASSAVYNRVKGSGYLDKIDFITELSAKFPRKVTTHLIVGLGETQMEMAEIIAYLTHYGITTSLFAFTPIKGTQMENEASPELETYRKIQIINYLLQNKHINIANIRQENEVLKGFKELSPILVSQELYDPQKELLQYRTRHKKVIKSKSVDPDMENANKQFAKKLHGILLESEGVAFMTSGCPDCNRPYYNETTTATPFNYPGKPSKKDVENAIKLSGLF